MRLFAGFFPYALGYLKSAWHTIKDKLIVTNWNARGSSADFFCTVHFLYQGPAVRMLFSRPKQKGILVGSSMDPKMAREASFTWGSLPWRHGFFSMVSLVLVDGDLHQDIRMIEDLEEECNPGHGSV